MNQQAKALSLAYEFVTKYCGYNQKQLTEKLLLNKSTLSRIKKGEVVRGVTYNYALSAFYKIIDEAFLLDASTTGGANSALFHNIDKALLRTILL